MPLLPQITLQPIEKWVINFVGPIEPQGKMGTCYIITAIEYLTRWVEAQPVKDCMAATITNVLFKNVLTRFGCPKILMSDRATHFLNETISTLTKEFHIYHQKRLAYPYYALGILNDVQEAGRLDTFRLVYGKEAVMPMKYIVPSLWIAAITGMENCKAFEERLAQLEELEEE
eukprot:PITA_36177